MRHRAPLGRKAMQTAIIKLERLLQNHMASADVGLEPAVRTGAARASAVSGDTAIRRGKHFLGFID